MSADDQTRLAAGSQVERQDGDQWTDGVIQGCETDWHNRAALAPYFPVMSGELKSLAGRSSI
jgi:hypothetical protein